MNKIVARLLIHYVENQNVVLTRDQLYEYLYGEVWDGRDRKVDIYTSEIRRLIRGSDYEVESVRHKGYIFTKKRETGNV
ncbi:MAG: winged helix family transcriptional regulator [Marivivens sp.]|nr:winged helix family transcriptional regulator [Marivivens sp.]NBT49955.1 winged helix family transcriptional regulator [Marivivens sp.]